MCPSDLEYHCADLEYHSLVIYAYARLPVFCFMHEEDTEFFSDLFFGESVSLTS